MEPILFIAVLFAILLITKFFARPLSCTPNENQELPLNPSKRLSLFKRLFKIAIIPVMLILVSSTGYSQTIYYDTYAFRIPLTLNNASLGITTDQTNFVALVKVTSPNLASAVCSDLTGALSNSIPPFAIVDSAYSTSQELYYQIENYNSTTGVIYFWVRLPTLYKTGSAKGSNKLYCYFGTKNPSVNHTTNWQKLTWSNVTTASGISYSCVYHFNESPATAAPQFADATVNNNNLSTGNEGSVTQNTSSQIGNGITLQATSVLDIGAVNLPNTQSSQSLSLWASYPATPPTTANLIVLENSNNPALTGNGTQLGCLVNGGTTDLQTWRWANRLTPLVKFATPPSAVVWHHYCYTYDASANKSFLYVDGVLIASQTDTSNPPFSGSTDMVSFGDYINNQINATTGLSGGHIVGGQSYTGTMDESHVIGTTLTADWVKAEYVNQKNPDAFVTAGPMQTSSIRAAAVPGYLQYTWKGVDSNIANPNNWNNTTTGVTNEVPVNANCNWIIPAGLSNYPVLTTDTGVYALTLASGASLNLNGHRLNVGCNIYNSSGGQILYASNNSSKVKWNGSISNQYYYGTNTPLTAQVGSMEVNNSSAGTITISGGPVDIFNLLTITKGNLVVSASPAALTLKSTSSLTASVTAIPSAYSISGNVTVERYISGGTNAYRGYRLISSPIYTASSGSNYYYDLSYISSYAPLTGTLGTGGGMTKGGNPTMYLYRDNVAFTNATFNTGNFRGVNTINNSPLYSIGVDYDGTFNLHVGTGVMFFYRGDLTNIATKYLTNTIAEPNVFASTGTLNQQTVTVTNWYTQQPTLQYDNVPGNAVGYGGYNLVGNPYACSIDWNTFSATSPTAGIYGPNVSGTIYIYNETTKVYGTYNNSNGIGLNGGTHVIPSGQGFFVQASATGASLTFNESAKTTAQFAGPTQPTGNTLLLNAMQPGKTGPQYIRLEMSTDSLNKEETVINFDKSAESKYVIDEDSQFLHGGGQVSLSSMSSDSVMLAINTIPYPKSKNKTVRLNINAPASGAFKMRVSEIRNVPDVYDFWLIDAFTGDTVNLKQNPLYAFNINKGDSSTFGANRLSVIIDQNKEKKLHLVDFTAVKVPGGVQAAWKTEHERDYTSFSVERSTDNGVTFNNLGNVRSNFAGNYNLFDPNPYKPSDQYRLKMIDLNGAVSYSNAVTITFANSADLSEGSITIYPNPAKGSLNLSINVASEKNSGPKQNGSSGVYKIEIVSSWGAVVKTATITQQNWQTDVSGLLPGTYMIQVIDNKSKSIVGSGTFVKL